MNKQTIASLIDHTMLLPTAGIKDIVRLCAEASRYHFASVCVNPLYVPIARLELDGKDVKVCTVVGFPLGAMTSQAKAFEAENAILDGADEIDMVMDIAAAIDSRFNNVETDILDVVQACRMAGDKIGKKILVKVILETCFLDDASVITASQCALKAGADFVKTSTGFASPKGVDGNLLPNGASVHHVSLMRQAVGDKCGVKASGGIRSARTALSLIQAGANRIGTSSGVQIVENWDESIKIKGWD